MKTRKFLATFALLAAVMMAATFTACSNDDNSVNPKPFDDDDATLVTNDQELRNAIKDGASIKLANDIQLSNSTLSIESGTKVAINLAGFTLDRKLTERGEGGGQVITVRSGATLNLSNGTLKGGWGGNAGGINNEGGTANLTDVTITGCTGDDKGGAICNLSGGMLTMKGGALTGNTSFDKDDPTGGGGIFNAEGATATLTDVTVTGNQAKSKGGGGICNYGTLTLDGCTITGNTCRKNGGGIYNFSTATLNMKGKMTITDNIGKEGLTHNVFLKENAVITVSGALTDSKIGITLEDETGTFTSGYKDNNSDVDPATIFTSDLTGVMAVSPDGNNEAQLTNALPDGEIYYIERSWDDASKSVKTETKILKSGDYTTLSGGDDIAIQPGTYVVKDDVKYNKIQCAGGGKHNIILCDGAKVTTNFVQVEEDNELDIYGQTDDNGQLVVNDEEFSNHAGIGSDDSKRAGTTVIHGGHINTTGSGGGASIGGGENCNGGTITIYGGNIHAIRGGTTSASGAGIGGGNGGNGGTITIYGGTINAEGGYSGAGIGSGNNKDTGGEAGPLASSLQSDSRSIDGGTITINGGNIEVHAYNFAAGIGGGNNGGTGNITINGGIVKAWGGDEGPGIGAGERHGDSNVPTGKLTVNGGEVYAYGGDDGAGIGGGKDSNGSDVTINGGYVYAKGNGNGSGIGSGCESIYTGGLHGGKLTVTGGRVEAYGGTDAAGIGGGEDADGGTVNISGGYVYAKGSYGGAGIGGGEGGDGANVTITGGTVHASAGSGDTGNRAIGPGYGDDVYGSLTVGDLMMVRAERIAAAAERHDMCWYRTDVHVELCTHPGYTADTCPYHKH